MNINEREEIIMLIDKEFKLDLISFELDIPMEELQRYKKQLDFRKLVNKAITSNKISVAIDELNNFIRNNKYNLVEKVMLLKLNSYVRGIDISEEDIIKIKQEKERIGMTRNIDEILEELRIEIPKIEKSCQVDKKIQKPDKSDYLKLIEEYKIKIAKNSKNAQNERNILAFTYFKAGMIDKARNELMSLIQDSKSYMAYRQLIYLEKETGNLDDAKLWAYEAIEQFSETNCNQIREQLISIAKQEKDIQEIIQQLKCIIKANPKDEKNKYRLKTIMTSGGR